MFIQCTEDIFNIKIFEEDEVENIHTLYGFSPLDLIVSSFTLIRMTIHYIGLHL